MKTPKNLNSSLMAATLCVMSASWTPALAEDSVSSQTQQTPKTQQSASNTSPQTVSKCSQLIGSKVENQQGECLGTIKDVVVSFDNNQVSYCILGVRHGFFGRTRNLAVPLAAFQSSPGGSYLVLNASRDNLARAKGIERNEWPSEIIPAWGAEPGPAVELPPAVVYGPAPTFVPPRANAWSADPISKPPFVYENASRAIDTAQDMSWFGQPLMNQ